MTCGVLKRSAARALACAATLLGATAVPAIAIEDLAGVGGVRFPERAFVMSVPEGTAPDELDVIENGEAVERLRISTASSGDHFGVVLAIDASRSMGGRSLRAAVAAARRFVDTRPPTLPVGILSFNRVATVVVPPTADTATLHDALRRMPRASGSSRVWSAATAAIRQIDAAGLDAGAVVLLSDGAGSPAPGEREALQRLARERHVRVHAVGIASSQYSPGRLRNLATSTGGGMLGVSTSAALNTVYRNLAQTLGGSVHLSWLSRAPSDTDVEVRVVTASKTLASFGYRSPKPPIFRAPPPKADESGSSGVPLLPLIAAASLICLIVALTHWQRRSTARKRLSAWMAAGEAELLPEIEEAPDAPSSANAPLSNASWWPRLVETFEIAGIETPPVRWLGFVFVGTVFAAWVGAAATTPLLGIVFVLGGIWGARWFVRFRLRRVRTQFAEQLADALGTVASAMRAGGTFATAISVLIEDAPHPTGREFKRIRSDEQLGIPIETAVGDVVRRMDNRDLDQVAMVCALQRDTGGAGAEAIDRVAETVRARDEVRRLVNNLTAQGRMSRWIMTLLPVFVLVLVSVINPGYLDPLLSETIGQILLGFAALLVCLGSAWIQRIVEIEI